MTPESTRQIAQSASAPTASMDKLTLANFSCDFSTIDVPQGKLNGEEIAALRDRFLDALSAEPA